MNVSLTPELERFISAKISSGRYGTASEVVREGLRLLETRERLRESRLGDVRKKIRVGLDQAKRGELLDGEAVFDELAARTQRRRRKRK
ncbi:MAG: type II toxin-antitoxin system ParD family antitoxin [Planctomycetes bacterium]|nr:type II toxin-antitoxin system ParD family antitoxin [Planctomycetota bacterium]